MEDIKNEIKDGNYFLKVKIKFLNIVFKLVSQKINKNIFKLSFC